MNRLLTIFFLLIFPLSSAAAEGDVRAGEHDSFSRLVIDIPIGSDWVVFRNQAGYVARVPGAAEFDIAQIFNRIPKTRITGVVAEKGTNTLEISIGCECHALAFLWRPDKLVVDIKDGEAPDNSPFEEVESPQPSRLQLPIFVPPAPRQIEFEIPPISPIQPDVVTDQQATLSSLERIVVESLARGATQGLLTPSANLDLADSLSDLTNFRHIGAHIERNQPGLLAHTSIDFGNGGGLQVEPLIRDACLPDSYFAVDSWGSEAGFFETLAPLRAVLTDEFYETSHENVNQLAKAYLYFGFGREAKEALRLDSEMSQERKVLTAIGSIIDDDVIETDILKYQISCENAGALWAFMSTTAPSLRGENRNAIFKAFRSLPAHLQSYLSPRLSRKFSEIGDFESAELALSIEEYIVNDSVESTLAKSDLHSGLGDLGVAIDGLQNSIDSGARMTPEGLIDYFKVAIQTDEVIDPKAIALADILRFEYDGKEVAAELATTQIEALLAAVMPERALEVLVDVADIIGPDDAQRLISSAIISASETFPDSGFLDLAFSKAPDQASSRAQNVVAERLISIDLPERAAQLLKDSTVGEDMIARRYLRAKGAIELGDGATALQNLAGLSTEIAVDLRQRAELLQGDTNDAVEVSIGDNWRMGNWAALAQGPDALLQSVSLSVLDVAPQLNSEGTPLAEGRGLLEQSKQTRQLLDSIMERYVLVTD